MARNISAKPKPTLYLYDNDIPNKNAQLGDEVTFLVKGKVSSLSEDNYAGKKSMSQNIEISQIKSAKTIRKKKKKSVYDIFG